MPNPATAFHLTTLALTLSATLRTPTSPSLRNLTLDPCNSTADCLQPRLCTDFNHPNFQSCAPPNPPSTACFCFPTQVPECSNSLQCCAGEVCADYPNALTPICISRRAAELDPVFEVIAAPPGGYTLDRCTYSSAGDSNNRGLAPCRRPRKCFLEQPAGKDLPCNSTSSGRGPRRCVCRPPGELRGCKSDDDCKQPEECKRVEGLDGIVCVSPTAATVVPA